ncbi:histidinol-phosphatase [Lampropedia puyangensis]|uniref:Histidinol-phosphatase n=1 Tax=Lampropedia puyangensis TaxID=1330072 RepID=A0A4S8F1F1_9BURK|nr:histidinol-phosphatase [Lampropedia puyangensis]THU01083.1 histidinol-phosphatase [Lampropedia puyangensis]
MKIEPQFLAEKKKTALLVAEAARAVTLSYYGSHLPVCTKQDNSPVTEADRQTEQRMRAVIAQHWPSHGIYGEEYGAANSEAESVWVIDPIDGTKSFITGNPLWGTLVAYCLAQEPVVGVIDLPALGQCWVASQNGGTYCNGERRSVMPCLQLESARFQTTSPDAFTAQEWDVVDRISQQCAMRRFGGDCFIFTQLAAGHVDVVMESGLQPYDYMALVNIVQEAGGVISDWQGQPLHLHSSGQVLASASAALHAQVLAMLAQ